MSRKQVDFVVADSLQKLQKNLENLAPAVEAEMNTAIKDVAQAAYASIMAKAQSELTSTRQAYVSALDFQDLGDNGFLITLDGEWANKLEEGYEAYVMNPILLASSKTVQVGSRAGQPWVQEGKQGQKYAHVPMEKKPFSKAPKNADMAAAIRDVMGRNADGILQPITEVFKDPFGNPMQGKVTTAHKDSVRNPMLDGLVKYQKTYTNSAGKETTQSVYITYRTISENGKPWVHPGFKGLKAFEAAEKEIVEQIDAILKKLL